MTELSNEDKKDLENRESLLAQKLYFSIAKHLGFLCRDYNKLYALAQDIHKFERDHSLLSHYSIEAKVCIDKAYELPPLSTFEPRDVERNWKPRNK